MPALPPQDLNRLVTELTERAPQVLHALVVSADGVPVAASDRIPPDGVDQLAAMTAGLISLAAGASAIFDGGPVTQALVAMDRGTLVIMAIDDGSSLAVLADAAADLDRVAYAMTMLVQQAGSLFTLPARGAEREAGGSP